MNTKPHTEKKPRKSTGNTPRTEQGRDILFALQWADGRKLYGIKHVKGAAWTQ